jgi:hypothetical protein
MHINGMHMHIKYLHFQHLYNAMHTRDMHVHISNEKKMNVAKKIALAQEDTSATAVENGFPVPFTLNEIRRDTLNVFFFKMRMIGHMVDMGTGWRISGKALVKHESFLMDPDEGPEDLGLTYDDIKDTDFAKYVEAMYLYGCHGILDESVEAMDYETVFTWTAAILNDATESRYIDEWETYGAQGSGSAANCFLVAELANARRILEGHGHFYYFHGKDGESTDSDVLDVRQMALLAGMEEMSIRAAANPNRPNRLVKIDIPNQTRFSIEEAKKWLQARGRYVPITRQWVGGDVDLAKRPFAHTLDAHGVIGNRLRFLGAHAVGTPARDRYEALRAKCGYNGYDNKEFIDEEFLQHAAEILQFPSELFILRMKEAYAREELARVERKLRELESDSQ